MQVETVREHSNSWGEKFEKAKGDTYEVPDDVARQGLINAKLVKAVKPETVTATG